MAWIVGSEPLQKVVTVCQGLKHMHQDALKNCMPAPGPWGSVFDLRQHPRPMVSLASTTVQDGTPHNISLRAG